MSNNSCRFYEFGPFCLDTKKRLLLRDQRSLPLTSKAFDTLLFLVQNSQRVMDKDELMKLLWPDSFVEEANLAQNVSMLRKVLGDSPSEHRYIVTVPGRGYQFVAEVRDGGGENGDEVILEKRTISRVVVEEEREDSAGAIPEAGPLPSGTPTSALFAVENGRQLLPARRTPREPSRRGLQLGVLGMLGVAVGLIVYALAVKPLLRQNPAPLLEARLQQLTTNPTEVPVLGAAISPDGKLLAYIDRTGVFVRVLRTGETQPTRFIDGFIPSFYSLKWFPDGTRMLVSGCAGPNEPSVLYVLSVLGESPRKLREGNCGTVSPDGSQIASVGTDFHSISLMGASGESPHPIVALRPDEWVQSVSWSPSGRRIAYSMHRHGEHGGRIETCDLSGAQQNELLAGVKWKNLFDLVWTPGGRLLYPFSETVELEANTDLWEIGADPDTGKGMGSPKETTHGLRSAITSLTATADGKRLAFLRFRYESDVYVSELSSNGNRLSAPRRLTLDDANDWPQGWTHDSRAVIFHSDRRGRLDIFRQDVHGGSAEAMVVSSDDKSFPRTSPDGRWVLYWASPSGKSDSNQLMRVPANGGPPELVLNAPSGTWFRCATHANATCVLGERSGGKITFFALNPVQGRGRELRSADLASPYAYFWDLSPDGSQVVIVGKDSAESGHFLIVPLNARPVRTVEVRGWKNLFNIVWAADGRSFFAFSGEPPVPSLLKVELDGRAHLLWKSDGSVASPNEPLPSPDGKYLAFLGWKGSTNVWMIEDF